MTNDVCFGVKGKIINVTISGYRVLWEDDGKEADHESLSHFCRKLTKLEQALK